MSVSGKSGEMSVEDFEIRAARLDEKDIEAIVHQRRAMTQKIDRDVVDSVASRPRCCFR